MMHPELRNVIVHIQYDDIFGKPFHILVLFPIVHSLFSEAD